MLNTVLEVGIGLIVLYSLLGVLCSAINELLSSATAARAKNLREGIENLLGEEWADKLYAHPMIRTLYRDEGPKGGFLMKVAGRIGWVKKMLVRPPSYLPADKFALAVLSLAAPSAVSPAPTEPSAVSPAPTSPSAPGPAPPSVAECVTNEVSSLPDGKLKETLQLLWLNARNDVDAFEKGVENWFDDGMKRVAGWYKRKTQARLLVLGIAVAVALNVNTITISQRLWGAAPLRAAVVEQSKKLPTPTTTPDGSFGDAVQDVQDSFKQVSDLQLPMGWGQGQRPNNPWSAALGWAFTAAALSLGAPFWFDLLNKVARLRTTGVAEKTDPKSGPPARRT